VVVLMIVERGARIFLFPHGKPNFSVLGVSSTTSVGTEMLLLFLLLVALLNISL